MEVERLTIESLADDKHFETGQVDSSRGIQIALMKRAETSVGGYAIADDDAEEKLGA